MPNNCSGHQTPHRFLIESIKVLEQKMQQLSEKKQH